MFPPDSPWNACLEHFLGAMESRSGSPHTYRMYSSILQRFFHSEKTPDLYTRQDVENFLQQPSQGNRNRGQPLKPSTRNQRLGVLASFYHYAESYTVEGKDGKPQKLLQTIPPTLGMTYGKPIHSYRFLTYEEFERLFESIPRDTTLGLRDRAVLLLYFWSARRRSEIATITWGDIEQATIIEKDGTRRQGYIYRFRGKGKSLEDDYAELPKYAMEAILAYLEHSGRRATIKPGDALFLTRDGTPLTVHGMIWNIKKYARQVGLEHKVSFHTFRHTAARFRHEQGEDVVSINRLLRHSSLDMTYHYLATLTGTSDEGAKLLEEKFGKFS